MKVIILVQLYSILILVIVGIMTVRVRVRQQKYCGVEGDIFCAMPQVNQINRHTFELNRITDSSVNNWNNENIETFVGCDVIFETYETSTMLSLRIFVIVLYSITELIFSIVILRLFVSRVLSLAATFDEIKIAERQKNNTDLSMDAVSSESVNQMTMQIQQ